jgi:hypothetical protein
MRRDAKLGAPPRRAGALLLIGVAAIALVLVTQRALAAELAGFLAGVWVAAMGAVIALIGAVFGHSL